MCEPRRTLLEVLKWVEATHLLRVTAIVSHLWSQLSACDELWICLSEDAGLEVTSSPKASYREEMCAVLPVMSKTDLRLFTVSTKKFRPLITFRTPLTEDYCNAAVILPERNLLVCGGNCSSALLFSLTGAETVLHRMVEPRSFHSAVYSASTVYVFGGTDSRQAEKLSYQSLATINTVKWQALSPMIIERSACSPCVFRTQIYLCGGNTDTCEAFDIPSERFSLFPISLPEEKYGCVAFMTGGELLILTESYITRYRPAERTSSVLSLPVHYSCVWTSMQQVLYNNCVYSSECGVIRCFDMSIYKRVNLN